MAYDARDSKLINWAIRKVLGKLVPKAYQLTCDECGLRAFKLTSWNINKKNDILLYYKCICCGKRKKVTVHRSYKKQKEEAKLRRIK